MTEIEKLKEYRIGVLAGGTSNEREISLKSGMAVFNALTEHGLYAEFVDIQEEGSSWLDALSVDVAFLALHGSFGEDGTIQKMLQDKGIAYTGSGPEASRNALDKIASKRIFSKKGILTPEYRVLGKEGLPESAEEVDTPCVVKPQHEGSSIGLSIVCEKDQLAGALKKASEFEGDIIVEKYISGREITVGIIDEEALPVVEIKTPKGCYDYDAKYLSNTTEYIVPAVLDADTTMKAQDAALRAHTVLGCSGFSRVDMRLEDTGEIYVLEVNTIPGLTERSLLPMAARAAGLDFLGLCVKVLYLAVTEKV